VLRSVQLFLLFVLVKLALFLLSEQAGCRFQLGNTLYVSIKTADARHNFPKVQFVVSVEDVLDLLLKLALFFTLDCLFLQCEHGHLFLPYLLNVIGVLHNVSGHALQDIVKHKLGQVVVARNIEF
jgi:hypothetical protein